MLKYALLMIHYIYKTIVISTALVMFINYINYFSCMYYSFKFDYCMKFNDSHFKDYIYDFIILC